MKALKSNLLRILYVLIFVSSFTAAFATPYVVVVSYDAFRHDYISRGITPVLDNVKNEGVWALSLQSSYPSITFPNHVSILTGMYPEHHGILLNYFKDVKTGKYIYLSRQQSSKKS